MKKIIFILLLTFCISNVRAQMYSQPAKTKVNVEKPKKIEQPKAEKPRKQEAPIDTSNSYLGNGFVINAIFAVNRGVSSGDYVVYYGEGVYTGLLGSADASLLSYRTPIKNNFGYRIGAGFGFQNKKYALEFPFMFCVDRFKVPGVDPSSDNLKVTSIEVGVNVYIKLFKEKHYALIGQNFATRSVGINLGYGYYVTKLFNVSLRYKLDMFNSYSEVVVIHKDYGADIGGDKVYRTNVNSNSVQLVLSYDVVHAKNQVKYKTIKPENYNFNNNNNNNNNNNGNNNNNNGNTPQGPVNYSGYSDLDLAQALKEANTKSDLDAMLAIQKEIDNRKKQNEFGKHSYVQLQQELNKALDKEDYKQAELIKKEIAKRDEQKGPSNKSESDLSGKTIQELNKLKEEAVLRDDFDRADLIKKEIAKRNAQPNKSDDLNNKTISELNKLKDEAVSKDDFDTAQKIQQIINKKKQQ